MGLILLILVFLLVCWVVNLFSGGSPRQYSHLTPEAIWRSYTRVEMERIEREMREGRP